MNKANEREPVSAQVRLNVFFAPKTLKISVNRPERPAGYDRTTDFKGGQLRLLSQGRKVGRNEEIRLVLDGELVQLRCQAGKRISNQSGQ